MTALILHLALIHLLMAMIPGPNTLAVTYCATMVSRRAGLMAAAGIGAASFVWLALSLLGIGALLASAGDVYRLLRIAGAAYLFYVGCKMVFGGRSGAAPAPVYGSGFRAGLLTTLSNPKSAVFWTSVFAVLLPSSAPAAFYAVMLIWITLQAFLWYGLIAVMLSGEALRRQYFRFGNWLNRLAGGLMILLSLRILNEARKG